MMRGLGVRETFGLSPLSARLGEVKLAFQGDGITPPSRFDRSSLHILQPALSVRTWLGWRRDDGRIPIYNFFNRIQTPPDEGWSVRVTQARDWRGGDDTYDSHNGTDFVVPVGTMVVAAAPGRVLRISSEFNRGGLKIFIDHGGGLITTSNHLGRALVKTGDRVRRGTPVALSGASGLDMLMLFPWNVPHVHFNVWLNGEAVDPFGAAGETPLWRTGNAPVPDDGTGDDAYAPTAWDPAAVAEAITACRDEALRTELQAIEPLELRAMTVLFRMNYDPVRFTRRRALHAPQPRTPRLDLPFRREDATGVVFPRRQTGGWELPG